MIFLTPAAYVFCFLAMLFVGRLELRSDDTGVVVGLVLLVTLILGALDPKRAWKWALAGWCVPMAELIWGHTGIRDLVLITGFLTIVGLAGSYAGVFLGFTFRRRSIG